MNLLEESLTVSSSLSYAKSVSMLANVECGMMSMKRFSQE